MSVDKDLTATRNVEAEMSVLGAMILSPSAAHTARSIVSHDDFWLPAHGDVFLGLVALLEAGTPIDLVTLRDTLQGMKKLDSIGGEDYLVQVAEAVPSAVNVEHYCQIVREKANRRRILQHSKELAEAAKNPEATISEVIAKAQEVSSSSASLMARSVFAKISEIDVNMDREVGITTGINGLDSQITMQGYPAGQLSLIRAYHKGGKSTFLIQSALSAAQAGYNVLYATFADLHRKHIKRRMMRMLTGWQYPPDGGNLFDDWHKELDRLNEMPIDVYDVAEVDDGGSVEEFTAWCNSRIKRDQGWDVVFVDYAQELASSSSKVHGKMEEQMECARVLNRFASRTKTAVVVGSQITNDISGVKRTKWGRDWEEKAGWVLTMLPPDKGGNPSLYHAEISYSRFGPQAPRSVDVPLMFNPSLLCMEEV